MVEFVVFPQIERNPPPQYFQHQTPCHIFSIANPVYYSDKQTDRVRHQTESTDSVHGPGTFLDPTSCFLQQSSALNL